jgi:hypothetical protein
MRVSLTVSPHGHGVSVVVARETLEPAPGARDDELETYQLLADVVRRAWKALGHSGPSPVDPKAPELRAVQ